MPNVAVLIHGAPHVEQGQRFIEFLVSAEAEKILADSDAAQYPLHPGVKGPTLLPPLEAIRAMDLDYFDVSRQLPTMDATVNPDDVRTTPRPQLARKSA